jgi:arginase
LQEHALPDCERVYVHIDVDVLDPSISPGTNFQGSGGLSVESLIDAIACTFNRYRVAALTIANYNPEKDIDNRTRDIVVQLIHQIDRLPRRSLQHNAHPSAVPLPCRPGRRHHGYMAVVPLP